MIRLDRGLILSSPVSICVFCGSSFLVYCRHSLANSLTPAEGRDRAISTVSAGSYPSQRRHTAIHEQQGAGDVGSIVGGQKQYRGCDLLGPARALQHGALCGAGVVLLDGLASRRDAPRMERRENRARADGVHPNALRRVVSCKPSRQARDRRLGGVVLQVAAARDDGTHRGDVDDSSPGGAALVAAHQRNRRLGTEGVAHQIDAEDLVPARGTRLVYLLVFTNASIVDEDIQAPEFFP